MWCFMLLFWVNRMLHSSHLKGFFPVCLTMWTCRALFWLKALSHWLHLKGRSPARHTRQMGLNSVFPQLVFSFFIIRLELQHNSKVCVYLKILIMEAELPIIGELLNCKTDNFSFSLNYFRALTCSDCSIKAMLQANFWMYNSRIVGSVVIPCTTYRQLHLGG